MKTYLLSAIAACLFLISCGTTNNTTMPASNEVALLSGSWELTYISGPRIAFEGLYPTRKPTIIFDVVNKRVSGNTGCNSYSGTLVADNSIISFTQPIAVTKMACADGMLGETTYLEMLKRITKFSVVDGTTLNFMAGNIVLMRFTKK